MSGGSTIVVAGEGVSIASQNVRRGLRAFDCLRCGSGSQSLVRRQRGRTADRDSGVQGAMLSQNPSRN